MKVAFLGLGTMGEPMARNLMKAGHQLTVYNRTLSKADALKAEGAAVAATPAAAVKGAEVIITMVSDTPDVQQLLLGENGVIEGAEAGQVVVDMSTISPSATRAMAAALAEKGVGMVDAPVSGGSEGAIHATLSIMCGGDEKDLAKVTPLLEAMGKRVTHLGPVGAGQVTKSVNQIICGGTYWAVAEGMALAMKSGLDAKQVAQAISGGAADSWVLNYRAANMVDNNYPLGFRMRLHQKDLRIALAAADEAGVALPLGSLVQQVENALVGKGHGDEDLAAVARALRELAGLD